MIYYTVYYVANYVALCTLVSAGSLGVTHY